MKILFHRHNQTFISHCSLVSMDPNEICSAPDPWFNLDFGISLFSRPIFYIFRYKKCVKSDVNLLFDKLVKKMILHQVNSDKFVENLTSRVYMYEFTYICEFTFKGPILFYWPNFFFWSICQSKPFFLTFLTSNFN
jgi:hypothetical protein